MDTCKEETSKTAVREGAERQQLRPERKEGQFNLGTMDHLSGLGLLRQVGQSHRHVVSLSDRTQLLFNKDPFGFGVKSELYRGKGRSRETTLEGSCRLGPEI